MTKIRPEPVRPSKAITSSEKKRSRPSQLSPEEQIAATRAKLRDLVQQCLAGNIQRTELPERFYTLMKNEFPLRYLAEPIVNHYMSDTSDLPLEARMIYGATMLPTLQRILAEAQGR